MQKAFEKIKERLEKYTIKNKDSLAFFNECGIKFVSTNKAIEIVNQTAEEYKARKAHFGCNDNGEHEKCDGCGIADGCPSYKKYLFENTSTDCSTENSQELTKELCEWWICNEEDNVYFTTCRNAHILLEGSPIDNSYEFCPYCGKKIKVIE